ncbi:MAG: O-antigen ligase family protein [bacterium]
MKNQIIKICDVIIIIGLIIYSICATTTISGQSIGISLAFLGWIFRMIIKKEFEIKNCPFNKIIFSFFIALFVSCLFSANISQSLNKLILMIGQMLLYYLVICGIKTKKVLKIILSCLIISTTLQSIYVIYQYFIKTNIFWKQNMQNIEYLRCSGTLDCVNSLAIVLAMVLPLCLILSLESSFKKKQKAFLVISSLLIFTSLILTLSRGAWIGFFISFIFIIILKGRKFFIPIISYSIILVIISTIFFPKLIITKIKNTLDLSLCTNKTRLIFWQGALTMLKTNPITGVGLDRFRKEYYNNTKYETLEGKEYGKIEPDYKRHFHAHNNFLNFGAESGLLGLGFFVLLLFVFLETSFSAWKNYPPSSWKKNLTLGLFSGIIVLIIHGLFDFNLKAESGHLFWFLIGIIVLIKERIKEN